MSDDLVFCNDVNARMKALGLKHKAEKWCIFID
jgi:hypothetical protein